MVAMVWDECFKSVAYLMRWKSGEWVRESTEYKHWYFGHLHLDEDLFRHQTCLWFQLRDMETNKVIE